MKDDPIPPEHHVSRWCKAAHCDQGVIAPSAFMLEKNDTDDALSVNWLEYLNCPDRSSEITEIQQLLSKKMKSVNKNSRIAVLNVGQALTAVNECLNGQLPATVLHNPDKEEGKWEDPSHSSIYGLPRNGLDLVAATALRDAIKELHPAASP